MISWMRWLPVIAVLALAFVAVSAAVQSIGQGSWTPVEEVLWIPAVIPACMPGTYRRCLPRRSRQAG